MTDLIAWLVGLLFPFFATAATATGVLLSILYVLSTVKKWLLERFTKSWKS